jgi:hypothetical protein
MTKRREGGKWHLGYIHITGAVEQLVQNARDTAMPVGDPSIRICRKASHAIVP